MTIICANCGSVMQRTNDHRGIVSRSICRKCFARLFPQFQKPETACPDLEAEQVREGRLDDSPTLREVNARRGF